MSKNQKLYITISLILIGTWLYATPYIAIYSMKQAAEDGNATIFSSYVNFPSLRESFKNTLKAVFNKELMKDSDSADGLGNLGKVFGVALVSAMVDPLVDSFITPENISMMMEGKKPEIKDPANPKNKTNPTNENSGEKKPVIHMGYEGFDYFVLEVKNEKDEVQIALLFERKNFVSWQLSGIKTFKINN